MTAIAWADDNGKEAGVGKLATCGCTLEAVRLLTRCFFSTGAAGMVASSGVGSGSTTGAGFSLDSLAATSRLRSAFFFLSLGVGVASPVSRCSGGFADVASCGLAQGAL